MKVDYFVKQEKCKNLAIWYYGKGRIAEITYLNRKITIVSPDTIFLKSNDGKSIKNKFALNYLHSEDFTSDEQLYNHNNSNFGLDFFGEFDFIYENIQNGSTELMSNDERYYYTDSIEFAKSKILDDNFWIDTAKPIKKVTTINTNENWLRFFIKEEKFFHPKEIN